MYFSDAMAYNQQAAQAQYVLAAQMQQAGQVVQQQQAAQQVRAPQAQQQAQTIAEQQHQAAAALELSTAAAAPAANTNAMNIRRPFDPTAHELDANFRLTRFADLKG